MHSALPCIVEIKMHLAGVGVSKLADLQVNDHQAPQSAVKEEQIHAIPLVTDAQALLPADKTKIIAQFQEEALQMPDERLFQIDFGVFILETEKFEHKRVPDFLLWKDAVFRKGLSPFAQHGGLVSGQGGPFVELGVDLPVELPHRPAAAQGFSLVKFSGLFIF